MNNKNLRLKAALLSCCFVTASINAISGNIPEMAKTFDTVDLYVVELISTIPLLFKMVGILSGTFISKKVGYKNNIVLAILLCGISGITPIFISDIYIILFVRGIFGFGAGLITTTLLTLIIYFFEDETRSAMIGMQGSIGGLGSLVATFISGRLLVYGWNASFYTYFIAFIILVIFVIFVPKVGKDAMVDKDTKKEQEVMKMDFDVRFRLTGYAGLMFISVAVATLYIIKCSTLITTQGYGSAQDGSTIIMLISMGSLCSGALYGKMVLKMKKFALPIFYLSLVVAFVMATMSSHLVITLISGFMLGFGLMAFVPYLQDIIHKEFSTHSQIATSTILVAQSLGGFSAPYLGNVISIMTPAITNQFIVCAVLCGVLTAISLLIATKDESNNAKRLKTS